MKVRELVAFNRSTYKVDGFVDYGDGHDSETAADHALVLMFVPLFHSWVQPISSFATRHAAPGIVLARFWKPFSSYTSTMQLSSLLSVMVPASTRPCGQVVASKASCTNRNTKLTILVYLISSSTSCVMYLTSSNA